MRAELGPGRALAFNVLNGERVELVGGKLIHMSPQKHPHACVVGVLNGILVGLYGMTHVVRVRLPLDLTNESQPEPDFAVVTKELHRNSKPHPPTADLIIEVSDTSLAYDRDEKGSLYAAAGISEYWIVNLVDGQVEVSRNPGPDSLAAFGARYLSAGSPKRSLRTWRSFDFGHPARVKLLHFGRSVF